MKTKKIIALALAMLMSISMLAGCNSSDTSSSSTSTEVTDSTTTTDAVVEEVEKIPYVSQWSDSKILSTTAASSESSPIVFTFDGGSVAADIYAYGLSQAYSSLKSQVTDTSVEFDYAGNFEAAKEYAMGYLAQMIAIDKILEENHFEMSATTHAYAAEDLAYAEEQYGKETFEEILAAMGVSREGFETEQLRLYAFDEAVTAIYGLEGDALYEAYEKEYLKTQHILVAFETDESGAVSDETRQAALDEAQEALDAINSGELTFEEAVALYNDDTVQPSTGYAYRTGYMVEEFEQIAEGLEEGDLSGLLETSYGFHIMKGMPTSLENFEENADNIEYMETYSATEKASIALSDLMEEILDSFVETEACAEITSDNYKDYFTID